MRNLIACIVVLLAACGGGGGNGNPTPAPTLTSIAVAPASPSTPQGVPTQFTATGTYTDGTSKDITTSVAWSSGTAAVAAIDGKSGLATAMAAGSSLITATLGSVSGTSTLTVTTAALQSIAVTPTNPTIAVPQTAQFTAVGTYADGTSHDITKVVAWSSGTTAVAAVAGSTGLATAVSPGASLITAKLNLVSGSTALTVTPAVLLSIAVTPTNPSLSVPRSIQLTATGSYSDGTTQDISSFVTWSSSSSGVASITGSGVAAALAPGATLVTAAMGSISGATTVTVTPAVLQSIAVTPVTVSIPATGSQQFVAKGSYSDGTFQDLSAQVTWTSGTTTVATVNAAGLAAGKSAGSTVITATLGTLAGSATLTVNAVVLQSIAVTPVSPSIQVAGSQQFSATGTYSDGTNHDITGQVTWSSGNTSVATITGGGLAAGVGAGAATITAKSGSLAGNATLTVVAPVISGVTPGNVTLGSAGTCSGGTLTTTFQVTAASNVTWTAAGDPNTPVLGGGTLVVSPTSGTGLGSMKVTITVPPQPPSTSYSNCSLTYTLNTYSNVWVTFSDGAIVGVTVYWTFVGTT
jgi:uncharacterized protein YjdB